MAGPFSLTLFRESPQCRACGHRWGGCATGFARGHAVLTRDGRYAFIGDDIVYSFPEAMKSETPWNRGLRLLDFAEPLLRLGWHDVELDLYSCPACGSRDFRLRYDPATRVTVPCTEFDGADFKPTDDGWELTSAGAAKAAAVGAEPTRKESHG